MSLSRISHIAAILYGVFALYTSGRAIRSAIYLAGEPSADIIRFGFIAVSVALGLAMVLPHRTIPALRRMQETYSPLAPRMVCGVAFGMSMMAARLSGAAPGWIMWSMAILFVIIFLLPGLAYHGVPRKPAKSADYDHGRIGSLMGEYLRTRPRAERYVSLTLLLSMFVGTFCYLLSKKALANPAWEQGVTFGVSFVGVGMGLWWMILSVHVTPREFRRQCLPRAIMLSLTLCVLSIVSYRALLLDAVPNWAARLWGQDAVQIVTVEDVEPHERRKLCSGVLTISSTTKHHEICNLSQDFLNLLVPGDRLEISGKSTVFGQTIERLRRIPRS